MSRTVYHSFMLWNHIRRVSIGKVGKDEVLDDILIDIMLDRFGCVACGRVVVWKKWVSMGSPTFLEPPIF